MTDDLDATLQARLERLAHAVPVPPERPLEPAVSGPARYRHGNPIGTIAAAVLILVVVLVAAYAAVGRGQPAIVDTVSDGMFRLSIQATKGTYDAEEPIDVVATLEFVGQDPAIEVGSHPGMPGFGVERVDGTNRVDPAYLLSCVSYSFVRGQPVAYPFAKSGGLHDDIPYASFIAEYLNVTDGRADPVLRLPPGTWRIFAVAMFSEGDCGGVMHTLEAGITVVVGVSTSSTALPSASVIALSSTPSPIPPATATPVPSPTLPPPDVAVPYPDGCAAYGLSERRCAYIVDWALTKAGIRDVESTTIELLGDPDCPDSACVRHWSHFIVRIRLTPATGTAVDVPLTCSRRGGRLSLLCTEHPQIQVRTVSDAYTDVPCSGPAPENPCATPLPTIDPAAAADARPLDIATLDIPIDHIGSYSITLGTAVLPNGILSTATFGLSDDTPSDVLISGGGMLLSVTSLDGGPPFDNYYSRGWRAGTESVKAMLTFTVEWFEPGAILQVTAIHVD